MHPKYHNSYYWESLIRNRNLTETFNNEKITEQSMFFQGIIYNSFGHRKLHEDVIHFSFYGCVDRLSASCVSAYRLFVLYQ